LHYLIADNAVDRSATERLAELVIKIVEAGALDSLVREGTSFQGLSMSRMGFSGDYEIATNLLDFLRG